jgi:hypothetical protein
MTMKNVLGCAFVSVAFLASGAALAVEKGAAADGATPEATTIVTLLKYGRDNKDAYALLTAYRMIAKMPAQPEKKGAADAAEAAQDKGAKKVDADPAIILDEAAKYAAGDASLLAQIDKARKELPTKRGCWYQWFCNAWGYCWTRFVCM